MAKFQWCEIGDEKSSISRGSKMAKFQWCEIGDFIDNVTLFSLLLAHLDQRTM